MWYAKQAHSGQLGRSVMPLLLTFWLQNQKATMLWQDISKGFQYTTTHV